MTRRTQTTVVLLLMLWVAILCIRSAAGVAEGPVQAAEAIHAVASLTAHHPPAEDYIRSRALTVTSLMLSAAIGVGTVFTVGWLLQGDGSDGWSARLPVGVVAVCTGVAVFLLLLHHGDRRHGVHWRTRLVHLAALDSSPHRLQLSTGRCLRSQTSLPPIPSGALSQWVWRPRQRLPEAHDGGSLFLQAFAPVRVFAVSVVTSVPQAQGSVALGLDGIPSVHGLAPPAGWQIREPRVYYRESGGYVCIQGEPMAGINMDWTMRQVFNRRPRALLVAVLEPAHSELKGQRFDVHTLCQELPVTRDLPPERRILFDEVDYVYDAGDAAGPRPMPRNGLVVSAQTPTILILQAAPYVARRNRERVLQAYLNLGLSWDQTEPGVPLTEEVALSIDVKSPGDETWLTVGRVYHRPVDDMSREALIAEARAWETFRGDPQGLVRPLPADAIAAGRHQVSVRLRCEGRGAVARVSTPSIAVDLACNSLETDDEDAEADGRTP